MVLIVFLVAIASICNAIMDIITHKYSWSIFSKYHYTFNSFYWDPSKSWRNKYIDRNPSKGRKKVLGINIHPAFTDAWHLLKSIMIVCLLSAIVIAFYMEKECLCIFDNLLLNIIMWVGILGTVWNILFSLFYNKILRSY